MLKTSQIWLLRQPLLLPFASLTLAILSVDNGSPLTWVSLFLVLFITTLTSRKLFLISFALALSGSLLHHQTLTNQREATSLDAQPTEIYGIIDSPSNSSPGRPTEAIIKILQGPEKITGSKIIAYIPEKYHLQVGEKIWLKGTIRLPRPAMNPRVFNKPDYLHRQGIAIELWADHAIPTEQIATTHKLHTFAESSRHYIRQKLTSGIENTDSAKVILAMFLGEKPDSNGDIITDFKHSGTIHVFAVSGLHVMMIGLIFALLLKLCRLPSNIWIPSVILLMFFYAIVTGMRPPALRASIMGAIVLTAILLLRKPSLPNCLWLSGIIALLWNTHTLFLPGFQLSYAVLIAIAFTGSWCMNRYQWINCIDPFFPQSLLTKKQQAWLNLRKKSSDSLAISTSAWFGSSFLIWLYFGLITPIAIIASVPLMFIVFLLLGTCCLSLTLGSISPTLGKNINQLNAHTANAAHGISHFFASIPNSRYHAQPWSTGERIVIYSLSKGGGAAYLSLGGGILLDAGNKPHFYGEIFPSLDKNGARLDTLIASHPDINHVQGLTQALQEFPIKQLLTPPGTSRSTTYNQLLHTAQQKGTHIIHSPETTFPIADGINLELIHSPPTSQTYADDRTLVFLLHWHGKRILFLNDGGYQLTHWLRQRLHNDSLPKLTPDILILGKHKLDDSLHPDIIELLSPKTIIATHSHFPPDQSRSTTWINAIKNQGINLYLLNQSGAVTITQEDKHLHYETIQDYNPK
ncbi:MAG: ComEC/Rec2 family competence protein [Akkermansiaceae bacterium]